MSRYSIVGDWGTSRLRLFRIVDGRVVDRREGNGIGAIETTPEATLRAGIAPWRETGTPERITLCGMIGSRNGWIEVPYVECPADVAAWRAGAAQVALDGVAVTLLPGLAGTTPGGAPDVMRGEETQIFGAMALGSLTRGRHRIALPGTHSKWASVADGRIGHFQTFFTGELFALLRDRSILTRAALPDAPPGDAAAEDAGFLHGLARAREDMLLGALFEARSAQLRLGRSPAWALGYLSGLLVGREVGEAIATLAPDERVTLIGDPALCARYHRALATFGVDATLLDGDACALAGLALMETAC